MTNSKLSQAILDRDAAIIRAIACDLRTELTSIATMASRGWMTADEADEATAEVQTRLNGLAI